MTRKHQCIIFNLAITIRSGGRFINADGFAQTAVGDVLSANMYAYCENNPINGSDPSGRWYIPPEARARNELAKSGLLPQIQAAATAAQSQNVKVNNNATVAYSPGKAPITATKTNIVTAKTSNSGHGNVPTTGKPNSTVPKPNGDLRVYGPDGKALKDIDYSHPWHHPELGNPHNHDWKWNGDNASRGPAYDPNQIVWDTGSSSNIYFIPMPMPMPVPMPTFNFEFFPGFMPAFI